MTNPGALYRDHIPRRDDDDFTVRRYSSVLRSGLTLICRICSLIHQMRDLEIVVYGTLDDWMMHSFGMSRM